MPEGPEVRITTDFLKTFIGKEFSNLAILSGRYAKKGDIPGLSDVFLPAKIVDVNCKGKFIYFTMQYKVNETCAKTFYMFSTLGMTGMWSHEKTKHSRFSILFDDETYLYYNDVRNFGTLKFVHQTSELNKKLSSLGPDMLSETLTKDEFKSRLLKRKKKTIVEALMDQSVVSGVGNYLKSETLYAAGIKPSRTVESLTEAEFDNLNQSIHNIIRVSYSQGGATIKNYRQPNGKSGVFSRRFAVYNCKTDPYNNIIVKEKTKDGRSTFWVPELQK